MDAFYDESRPCFHWSFHSPYLQARKEGDVARVFDLFEDCTTASKRDSSIAMGCSVVRVRTCPQQHDFVLV